VGRRNEYRSKGGDALWLGVKADMALFAGNNLLFSMATSSGGQQTTVRGSKYLMSRKATNKVFAGRLELLSKRH